MSAATGVRSVFQPIVDLRTGEVVGAEALSRDAIGQVPIDELIGEARRTGVMAELDAQCQASAVNTWLAAGMGESPLSLFVNVEPDLWGHFIGGGLPQALVGHDFGHRLVLEITERGILADLPGLLACREWLRENGCRLAIDDIGIGAESLAMIPLLAPDVMKLDTRIMRLSPGRDTAQVINAVSAEAERAGSVVLAEGIETERDLEFALSTGAVLGQGWLFGYPEPQLPPRTSYRSAVRETAPVGVAVPAPAGGVTPWQLVSSRPDTRRARKPLLAAMSRYVESQASTTDPATIVIGAFQDSATLSASVMRRFAEMARGAAFVGVLGMGVGPEPAVGVRGCDLQPGDPLIDEWTVVVLSPYFAAVLIAHDLQLPAVPDDERQFDYVISYDRDLVVVTARSLMARFPLAGHARTASAVL